MPIIKSAKKRVRIASRASVRNSKTKRAMREALKSFAKALEAGKPAEISKAQQAAVSTIDIAVKKAVIHKNRASRKKAQLAVAAKAHNAKPLKAIPKKPAVKAPAPKKPGVKKTTAKTAAKTRK